MTALAATPAAARQVRVRVRQWLARHQWPVEDAEDVELAVSEAVANVVDHAYPPLVSGPVSVHAWVSNDPRTPQRRVVMAVSDRGRWAAHHPASPSPAVRGHGLPMMRAVMAELHIQSSANGTTVIMVSSSVGAPPSTRPDPHSTIGGPGDIQLRPPSG